MMSNAHRRRRRRRRRSRRAVGDAEEGQLERPGGVVYICVYFGLLRVSAGWQMHLECAGTASCEIMGRYGPWGSC